MPKHKHEDQHADLTSLIESERAENAKFREETRDFRQEVRTELRLIVARLDSIDKHLVGQNTIPVAHALSLGGRQETSNTMR